MRWHKLIATLGLCIFGCSTVKEPDIPPKNAQIQVDSGVLSGSQKTDDPYTEWTPLNKGNTLNVIQLDESLRLATQGDIEAARALRIHFGAIGDTPTHLYWLWKGAEYGDVNAQCGLAAVLLYGGPNLPLRQRESEFWTNEAATQGKRCSTRRTTK
jgi:hypothetical protein